MATRDHRSTYQRRNEIAREQGFKGYSEKRKALDYARNGSLAGLFADTTGLHHGISARNPKQMRAVLYFYRGYNQNPDDYSLTGDKAKYIEEIHDMNREEFYPNLSSHSRWLWDRMK